MEKIATIRTPDSQFTNLPDWPYKENYLTIYDKETKTDMRMAYVDEGKRDSNRIILLLHGEPTWSYLYRHVIKNLLASDKNIRVVAPDLIGFGKSDKPLDREVFNYERCVEWLTSWFKEMNFKHPVYMFCQDWGGLLGLRVVAKLPESFGGLIISNTGLPDGSKKAHQAFLDWLNFSQNTEVFPIGRIIMNGMNRSLSKEEIEAYDAPFPDDTYKAAARIFPKMVPLTPEYPSAKQNKEAMRILQKFNRPDNDPVTKNGQIIFLTLFPIEGTKGQIHPELKGGHFIQEDAPEEITELLIKISNSKIASKL